MTLSDKALPLLCLATAVSGCTAIADLDSFERAPVCDLDLHLRDFEPHTDDLLEVRVVTDVDEDGGGEPDRLRARALLDPMGVQNVDISMPNAIDPGPHRIDFFADFNGNRMYDDPMTDHAWRIEEPCEDQPKVFEHVFDFQELPPPTEPGNVFTMTFEQMQVGVAFELRVVELPAAEQGFPRTVGLYRIPNVPDPDPANGDESDGSFEVRIEGIIETGMEYEISFWSDRNDDGEYDPPDTDEAWRLTRTGGEEGIDSSFTRIDEHVDIEEILVHLPER